jgi:hypothetical protein
VSRFATAGVYDRPRGAAIAAPLRAAHPSTVLARAAGRKMQSPLRSWPLILLGACAPAPLQGMQPHPVVVLPEDPTLIELSRIQPAPGHRALLVVHPRHACSGSAATVIVDDRGEFVGAFAPGTAALVDVRSSSRSVRLFSSVELTAPTASRSDVEAIELAPAPAGLLLHAQRHSTRQCTKTGQYTHATVASRAELERALAESDIRWRDPDPPAGRAWLAAHRDRVDAILEQR